MVLLWSSHANKIHNVSFSVRLPSNASKVLAILLGFWELQNFLRPMNASSVSMKEATAKRHLPFWIALRLVLCRGALFCITSTIKCIKGSCNPIRLLEAAELLEADQRKHEGGHSKAQGEAQAKPYMQTRSQTPDQPPLAAH